MPVRTPPVRTRRPLPQEPRTAGLRVDSEAVYQALDRQRRRQNLRYNQVAAALGINPATLTGWGHGVGFSTDHLARALAWLDLPLADFVTPEPRNPRPVAQGDAALKKAWPPPAESGGHIEPRKALTVPAEPIQLRKVGIKVHG